MASISQSQAKPVCFQALDNSQLALSCCCCSFTAEAKPVHFQAKVSLLCLYNCQQECFCMYATMLLSSSAFYIIESCKALEQVALQGSCTSSALMRSVLAMKCNAESTRTKSLASAPQKYLDARRMLQTTSDSTRSSLKPARYACKASQSSFSISRAFHASQS